MICNILIYSCIDLFLFAKEQVPEPATNEFQVFSNLLECIDTSESTDYPSKLRDRLKPILKGNKGEYSVLLEILACSEIIKPKEQNGLGKGRNDWKFVQGWRREDKSNDPVIQKIK